MDYKLCSICRNDLATKTNSHLIPSFLIAMVASSDHSGKRDTEVLYTVGKNITTAYIGRSVSQKALEENFNELSDERISQMTHNNAAMDYIFCPHCEEALAKYLESSYSTFLLQGKKVSSEVPYLFWASVIWRISYFDIMGEVKLKTYQEASIRNRLHGYFEAKDANTDISYILKKPPFKYRMLYCKGFSKKGSGMQYGRYDNKTKTLSIFFGDIVLCFHFGSTDIAKNYHFFDLEQQFKNAPLNDGTQPEQHHDITVETMKHSLSLVIDKMQDIRLKANRQQVIDFWHLLRIRNTSWLPNEPHESFIRSSIYHLYNDEDKIGEKITYIHFAKALANAFKDVYGIVVR